MADRIDGKIANCLVLCNLIGDEKMKTSYEYDFDREPSSAFDMNNVEFELEWYLKGDETASDYGSDRRVLSNELFEQLSCTGYVSDDEFQSDDWRQLAYIDLGIEEAEFYD